MFRQLSLVFLFAVIASPVWAKEPTQDLPSTETPAVVKAWVESHLENLIANYRWFHTHPELSFEERETSARIAKLWREAGFDVTTEVGGFGVVAILENGPGPCLMLRTDLDALPLVEKTQLAYASQVTTQNTDGTDTGVMHACGHDVHMTNLVGVAQFLAGHRNLWQGTLMLVGQPAEERGAGAKAMLEDGLFTRFQKPDFAIALHVGSDVAAGKVETLAGFAMANVDSVDITMIGRGGHGSAPHTTIDPIVQAAALVMDLQTIVSREIKPLDPAVVTVGSIHGGTKHNIIGDRCHLQLTVRSYDPLVREKLLAAIERKAKAVAVSFAAPEPEISIAEGTPSLRNDDQLAARITTVFQKLLGEANVSTPTPSMGGEDFSRYGRAGVPILMYRLGSVEARRLERYEELGTNPPSLHSSLYYPDIEPTLTTGLQTMVAAALEILGK
ncbi:putative hydrolase YxeP [Rosistilla oblonga]|uniref:M20 metallopeptidase family protein n=1 Tax=Rosistilla oblonga TaxID=2527990 RepID=UPI00118C602D|nr:amidohydrolase [Rosistilla oblonga]QDV10729.1 putative hydrolase YxeP [Rosistilla oblonga]